MAAAERASPPRRARGERFQVRPVRANHPGAGRRIPLSLVYCGRYGALSAETIFAMIVTTAQLFKHAYGKYAVGAYNINNAEQAMGLFKGDRKSVV